MERARIIRTSVETVVIPETSREQFLMQSPASARGMDDFKILQAGISRLTPGYLVERSPSYFNLILYCLGGRAAIRAGEQTLRMKPGEVLMIPTGCTYSYRLSGRRWEIAWIHLIDSPGWNRLFEPVPMLQKAHWGDRVRNVMEGYLEEAGTRGPDSEHTLRLHIELLVAYLRRELGAASHEDKEARERLRALWSRIHKNLRHKWTVRELSSMAGICKTSLFSLCEKVHRMTPMQMVTTMRMELASELLSFTNCTLDMIADQTGYKNAFAFSKAFKRHSGTSPKDFRRLHVRKTRPTGR